VAAWRSRGKVPVAVCATASLVEITLLDTEDSPIGHWCLRHLYSMALIRLINALVDSAQKGRFALSVDALLRRLEWPSWLGDLRHEATHGSLPSVELLRLAAQTALSKLHERFWLPQQDAVMESELAYTEDSVRIRRLVNRLFEDPSDQEVVAEVVSFGASSSRRAVTMVTSLVDRTVKTGDVDPLKAFCERAKPAHIVRDDSASHVQVALCAIQRPLRRRLLQPQTPASRIRPMCELFKSMDIDTSQWAMMEKMVTPHLHTNSEKPCEINGNNMNATNLHTNSPTCLTTNHTNTSSCPTNQGHARANTSCSTSTSQTPKRLPVIDNTRSKQLLGYKRRRTCSDETIPWMEVGYTWSWDMAATYSGSGSPFECIVHSAGVEKNDEVNYTQCDAPIITTDLHCAEDGPEMRECNNHNGMMESILSTRSLPSNLDADTRMEVDELAVPKAAPCPVEQSDQKHEGEEKKINISLLAGITSLF